MRKGLSGEAEAAPADWRVLRRLWPYVRRNRGRVSLALLLLALAKAATLTTPYLLKLLVDGLSAQPPDLRLPLLLVLAYGGLRLAGSWLGEWRDLVFGRVTERTMREVGVQIFAHLQTLDLAFHQARQTGSLSRDIERGVTGIRFLLRFLLFNILPTLLEVSIVAVILVGAFGWQFGAVMLAAVSAYIAWTVVVTERRTRHVRSSARLDSQAHGRAVDALLNFETVKYFGAERRETQRYEAELGAWEGAMRASRGSLALLNGGQALIIAVSLTAMLWLAARAVLAGEQTPGDFVMINAYLVSLFTPLNFLGFVYREIKASLVAMQRMFRLLDVEPSVRDAPDARPLALQTAPRLRFAGVGFAYQPQRPILDGVDFEVAPGTTTAIVGPSGSGKSTLARLLFRYYDPQQGRIEVEGADLRSLQLDSLRGGQDLRLAGRGVAVGDVVADRVVEQHRVLRHHADGRAQAAALGPLLAAAPEGLDTMVGERGLQVSGGEKQRIALARVLLRDPRILILDEATASLDTQSEAAVLGVLREAMHRRTAIAIAHRLSTVRDADQILVLEGGRIVERGDHAALLARGGLYAALWAEQSRAASPRPERA